MIKMRSCVWLTPTELNLITLGQFLQCREAQHRQPATADRFLSCWQRMYSESLDTRQPVTTWHCRCICPIDHRSVHFESRWLQDCPNRQHHSSPCWPLKGFWLTNCKYQTAAKPGVSKKKKKNGAAAFEVAARKLLAKQRGRGWHQGGCDHNVNLISSNNRSVYGQVEWHHS